MSYDNPYANRATQQQPTNPNQQRSPPQNYQHQPNIPMPQVAPQQQYYDQSSDLQQQSYQEQSYQQQGYPQEQPGYQQPPMHSPPQYQQQAPGYSQQGNPQQQPDPFASFNSIPLAAGINTFQTAFNASNQYMKNQSKTIDHLRTYFKVDHQYVLFRFLNIVFPFKPLLKNQGENKMGTEFDLYIPLMSFLTYILLVGLKSGKMKTFHPDVLGFTASFALFIYIVQFLVLSLFLYLNNVGSYVAWMDLIAIIGYMFVGGVLNTFLDLFNLGFPIGHVLRLYVCIAMAAFSVSSFLI